MAEVNRERVLLLGGQRALLMQLAHPLVAAGVADHSDFPARPLARLRRTLDLSLTLLYGTPEESREASAAIRAVHDRVTGSRYSANDPELLQWVNATLIDTALVVYQLFVRPLSPQERARYYAEAVASSRLFGIPDDVVPPDLAAFEAYLRRMLAWLRATDASRRLAHDVLYPPLPLPLRLPTSVARRVTLALLPERIREVFGLRVGHLDATATAAAATASRLLLPWTPPILREFSRARAARPGLRR